jgi:hypothetical protein
MMLGHPETPIAELLGMARKVGGVMKRDTCIASLGDRSEVEDGQGDHRSPYGPRRSPFPAPGTELPRTDSRRR